MQSTGWVQNLPTLVVTLSVGFVIDFGARLLGERRVAQINGKILSDLRVRLFKHLQLLSQSFYARTSTGNILARFSSDLVDIETDSLFLTLPKAEFLQLVQIVPAIRVAVETQIHPNLPLPVLSYGQWQNQGGDGIRVRRS